MKIIRSYFYILGELTWHVLVALGILNHFKTLKGNIHEIDKTLE